MKQFLGLETFIGSYCRSNAFTWWRHQMETFSALLALYAGNSPVPVNSPHKGQWRGALMFSLIYVWINGWVNNREVGDLRRHRGHYDVIEMTLSSSFTASPNSFRYLLGVSYSYPYPDGVYTPAWSVHSKATLLPLPPHSEYHRRTLGCHSPIEIHSNATSSALQMECTLHCHSYNLVFVHAYTPILLRGL